MTRAQQTISLGLLISSVSLLRLFERLPHSFNQRLICSNTGLPSVLHATSTLERENTRRDCTSGTRFPTEQHCLSAPDLS